MKHTALFIVCLSLIGCVVVVETPPPYVRQESTPPAPIITHPPKDPPVTITPGKVSVDCAPFLLPEAQVKPKTPNIADAKYQTPKDVEMALLLYIKQLRNYIKQERATAEKAYSTYLLSCRR